jgi:16S rRNA (cytosine967-C5)-methyltransferase
MTPRSRKPGSVARPGPSATSASSAKPDRSAKPGGAAGPGSPAGQATKSRAGRARTSSGSRADPARAAACDVLRAVADRDAYANLMLPSVLRERGLTGRDAALATELAYGTLRGQGTYDAILAICSDRPLDQIDPPIRQVLRLGAHQLLATRIRAHAAVATSVDLAREVAGQRPAGFVNAVLRKVATRDLEAWIEISAPPRADDPVGYLAIRYSHPRWIVSALLAALGETPDGDLAETEATLAADGVRPRVTLCAIPGLASPAELRAGASEPARWSPFGVYLAEGNPAEITAVAQNRASVQDEASQLVALALTRAEVHGNDDRAADAPGTDASGTDASGTNTPLKDVPGTDASGKGAPGTDSPGRDSRWLDLSAGPGGKARLLGGIAAGRDAYLVAADVRAHRARLVRAATAGTGRAGVVVADGTVPAWRQGAFDRVLADVPCSGLGALRRRPEARWRRRPADIAELRQLQCGLLAAALDSVRPGGVVAYSTCSPHLAETREVVAAVLAVRDDIEVLDAPALLPEVPGLACPAPDERYAQFWPHRHGTDGIFLAIFRRTAPAP